MWPGSLRALPDLGEHVGLVADHATDPDLEEPVEAGEVVDRPGHHDLDVLVQPGDTVAARQPILVVEAMKMENELRSPKDGVVAEIRVTEGTSVEAGALLAVVD